MGKAGLGKAKAKGSTAQQDLLGENERELSLGPHEVSVAILTKSLRDNATAIKTL